MNIYHGLLFSGGYITDPKLAMFLGREQPLEPIQPAALQRTARPSRLRWFIEELVLLGGRPVSREHLDDLGEPFQPLHPCR